MKSLFAQLLIKVSDQIKSKMAIIRYIDQDLGQLENYEIRPAVSWPCVLIDFSQTSYEQMERNRQLGNITFTLRLGFDSFSSANHLGPQIAREKALEYYEIEQALYEAIQGFSADDLMQDCTRISAVTERRDDPFRVRILTFTSMTEDSSAMPNRIKVSRPTLNIENT